MAKRMLKGWQVLLILLKCIVILLEGGFIVLVLIELAKDEDITLEVTNDREAWQIPDLSYSSTLLLDGNGEYLCLDDTLLADKATYQLCAAIINAQSPIVFSTDEMPTTEETMDNLYDVLEQTQYARYLLSYEYTIDEIQDEVKVYLDLNTSRIKDNEKAQEAAIIAAGEIFTQGMTQLEIVRAAYDYIVQNVVYDELAAQKYIGYDKEPRAFEMYGAIIEGEAVCSGYTRAFNYLLNAAGIETRIVSSTSMNHAWSMVLIDNEWYHCDTTYDDPVPDIKERKMYNYFLKNDEYMIKADHDLSDINSPKSTANSYNYDIYTNWGIEIDNVEYLYVLEDNNLNRYTIVDGEVDSSTQKHVVKGVSSWTLIIENGYIVYRDAGYNMYIISLNGGIKKKILEGTDIIILEAHSEDDKVLTVTYAKEINGEINTLIIE